MHVCDGGLGGGGGVVDDVCGAAVRVERAVDGQVEVGYDAMMGEYFAEVRLGDVLGELFDDDL